MHFYLVGMRYDVGLLGGNHLTHLLPIPGDSFSGVAAKNLLQPLHINFLPRPIDKPKLLLVTIPDEVHPADYIIKVGQLTQMIKIIADTGDVVDFQGGVNIEPRLKFFLKSTDFGGIIQQRLLIAQSKFIFKRKRRMAREAERMKTTGNRGIGIFAQWRRAVAVVGVAVKVEHTHHNILFIWDRAY